MSEIRSVPRFRRQPYGMIELNDLDKSSVGGWPSCQGLTFEAGLMLVFKEDCRMPSGFAVARVIDRGQCAGDHPLRGGLSESPKGTPRLRANLRKVSGTAVRPPTTHARMAVPIPCEPVVQPRQSARS